MGKISNIKVAIVIFCLIGVSVFIYRPGGGSSTVEQKTRSLASAVAHIPGWRMTDVEPLEKNIVEALYLDDYVNQSYTNGHKRVSLYIGYYYSAKKIGAAHDPMVCFPGQGWEVSENKKGAFTIDANEENKIAYASMKVKLGLRNNLVIYWFQSHDQTNTDTFSQKINLLLKKIFHQGENNAFVRITAPIDETHSQAEARETILSFIKSFYPVFLAYVQES